MECYCDGFASVKAGPGGCLEASASIRRGTRGYYSVSGFLASITDTAAACFAADREIRRVKLNYRLDCSAPL